MKSKKAFELPIGILVSLILGIVIFSLGIGLFFKIGEDSEDVVNKIQGEIKTGIAELECDGSDWVCSPSYSIKQNKQQTFQIFIANRGENNDQFEISLDLEPVDDEFNGIVNNCGSLIVVYLEDTPIGVSSGFSASVPMYVRSSRVSQTPCSFTTTATLSDSSGDEVGKTPVIVRVE